MLRAIKLLHTAVWAFFASAILAVPVLAWYELFNWAAIASLAVLVEVAILAVNGLRCPLTDVAERYTSDRPANFDIYLPLWLATWNKQIFGTLFLAGVLFALARWMIR